MLRYARGGRLAAIAWRRNYSDGASTSAEQLRTKLLSAALELVPTYSFTQETLVEACHYIGLPSSIIGLAENGPRDIVEHLFDRGIECIQARSAQLKDEQQQSHLSTVRELCRARLKFIEPYIDQWPTASAILSRPTNLSFSASQIHRLSDEIWFLADDRSFDTNYYTKRVMLSAIYLSTEMHMTHDKSLDFADTYEFLDRRLNSSMAVSNAIHTAKNSLGWGWGNFKGIIASVSVYFTRIMDVCSVDV